MVLSTTTFVDSVQSNRMLIREWTRINKLVLSTTTFVDSVQSNRMLIREWTRIDKLCRPKQEKQQIIRWDTSSHINKFVDQQDGSNNQIVTSVAISTCGVVPNRQSARNCILTSINQCLKSFWTNIIMKPMRTSFLSRIQLIHPLGVLVLHISFFTFVQLFSWALLFYGSAVSGEALGMIDPSN